MRKIFVVIGPMVLMACLFGSSKMLNLDETVCTVDARVISLADLDSVVKLIDTNNQEEPNAAELKDNAVDSLIAQKLVDMRIDSTSVELLKDWEFSRRLKRNIGETAKKILFQEQISGLALIDSAEIAEYYENNKDNFNTHEQVWAKHILIRRPAPDTADVESDSERQKRVDESDKFASERADAVLKKVLAGDNWDSLAATYSEDKTNASKGGDLGFFMRGRMVPEFDSVAFSTEPGVIAGPVSTKFGYHIIKVEEYKPTGQKPLEGDVESQIRGTLAREKEKNLATSFVDSLKEFGSYVYNNDLIDSDSTFSDDSWVMIVNATDTLFYNTFQDALPRFIKWKKAETLTAELKKEMLGFLQTNLLISHASKALGYMDHPDVTKAREDYVKREARQQVLNLMRDLEYEPSSEEIETYFYKNIDDYRVERKLLIHHIIFQDSTFAETIRDSILVGSDFVEMAIRYYPGEPEIREVAYNLDYIGPKDMGDVFYKAAEELKVGNISHPVKTKWGYHLIKLVNRKEDKTITQVKPGIKHRLKGVRDADKKSGLIEEWKLLAEIIVDEKLLNKYDPLTDR